MSTTTAEMNDLASSIRYHSRMVQYPRFRSSRNILMRKAHAEGMPISRIALMARLSVSHTRRILHEGVTA